MELSKEDVQAYTRRILLARMRLLCTDGFYGMLLMNVKVSLGDEYATAWAEEDRLVFNPEFLKSISDSELEYALLHLLLHLVLNHLGRRGEHDKESFDKASDIVVNSNILRSRRGNLKAISLDAFGGVQPHLTPERDEGWKYTVEEVYEMIEIPCSDNGEEKEDSNSESGDSFEIVGDGALSFGDDDESDDKDKDGKKNSKGSNNSSGQPGWDSHPDSEAGDEERKANEEKWKSCIYQACELIAKRAEAEKETGGDNRDEHHGGTEAGNIPLFAEMLIKQLKEPKIDWRTILQEFIQEEIVDYSFMPPDRRFSDSPFFLPDFNDKDEKIKGIWIAVDASGSVSDEAIETAVSEIKGCIEQFEGRFSARLSFFDAKVYEQEPIESVRELMDARPVGRGGTSFEEVFRYMGQNMEDDLPEEVIVITDGYCNYPDESMRLGIPVLWMLSNEESDDPPWGKIARFEV